MRNIEKCPHCGAKMVKYTHRLNRGMVQALITMSNESWFHPVDISKIGLTFSQRTNFQKLRYWELVRKSGESGCWSLTNSGRSFLSGKTPVHLTVVTYRNKFVEFKPGGVYIEEYFPEYQNRRDYAREAVGVSKEKAQKLQLPLPLE